MRCRGWIVGWAMLLVCAATLRGQDQPQAKSETLRVMSFNLWHGGDDGKQPLEQSAAVIKAAKADIVGLQETHGHAPAKNAPRPDHAVRLAKMLGWHYLDQGGRTGIISRYKITGHTPKKWGAKIELPSGGVAYLFNVHFASSPYQPYQLLNIPYGDGKFITTEEQAIDEARKARGKQVTSLIEDIKSVTDPAAILFITGDFNEPSHEDWTADAAAARKVPIKVHWPSTSDVTELGFIDTYRFVHKNPVTHRGLTWTPVTTIDDPKDRHDRIDFTFAKGAKIRIVGAQVVGESRENADIVVTPYPSDHRAVVAEIEIGR